MISRSAFTGVEADACANPQMISHAPFRATEGALTTLILILSPFRHSRPLPRGACPPKADHSGLRAGTHPLTSSLSSSRDDRPSRPRCGRPKWGAHTSLPIHERTRLTPIPPPHNPQPNMDHPPLAELPQVDQKPNALDTSPGFPDSPVGPVREPPRPRQNTTPSRIREKRWSKYQRLLHSKRAETVNS